MVLCQGDLLRIKVQPGQERSGVDNFFDLCSNPLNCFVNLRTSEEWQIRNRLSVCKNICLDFDSIKLKGENRWKVRTKH